MRISEAWLREWVDPPVDTTELAAQLTMAGLEVAAIDPAAPDFSGVVLGRVKAVAPHPDADKLRVCEVDTGDATVNIVCGAANVAAGQLVPVAIVGAKLPGDLKIRKAKLRGVESNGMICSARELGLGDDADGIMVLAGKGRPGDPFRDYLKLDDNIIEVELTPNRGDCLGMAGIAREVGVINRLDVTAISTPAVPQAVDDVFPVTLAEGAGCPIFAGRIIRGIDPAASTPAWLQERLRRGGIRPISPVVDVTNYVMLESGQPMHGYDLRTLDGGINVRRAQPGEKLTLLDGRDVKLDEDVLVIADASGVKGLAGIMGGEDTGVRDDTVDVFFEAAFFEPLIIAGRARRFGLHTDASHRFERGVMPGGQLAAVERATELLLEIAGGKPGPAELTDTGGEMARDAVSLRRSQLHRLLGIDVPDSDVSEILQRLEMTVEEYAEGWHATPPAFRFDIEIEADLIEEVARIYGYDRIPETDATEQLPARPDSETRVPERELESLLMARGFREVVTYSFIDPRLQTLLDPGADALALSNPISSEQSVMRTSLLPGLLDTLRRNLSRQQERARIFEIGLRYIPQDTEIKQEKCLAGLVYGTRYPEQWGAGGEEVDYFDAKGEVEALLQLTGEPGAFAFEAASHPTLHPGQAARITRGDAVVGWLGALHPAHQHALELAKPPFLFEILVDDAFRAKIPVSGGISRYPAVRRDISLFLDESVSAASVLACVKKHAPEVLRQIKIFDVYRDQGVDSGLKSVALGLILQDYCSTLTDGEADSAVMTAKDALVEDLNAKIRD